jgi:hypothetical protein|tara:strand:+ start:155 stop:571 length:417 start_codon:yes stop_codon:yes gene_type:complete
MDTTGRQWVVNSVFTKQQFLEHADKLFEDHKYVTFSWVIGKKRSQAQNNALHLWLSHLAGVLNDSGLDMKKVLKPDVDIPWSQKTAKEYLWRPVQEAVLGKESTTEPTTSEMGEVYETLNRHLAAKFGVSVPWPTKEE